LSAELVATVTVMLPIPMVELFSPRSAPQTVIGSDVGLSVTDARHRFRPPLPETDRPETTQSGYRGVDPAAAKRSPI
jgi:hypothetical protein